MFILHGNNTVDSRKKLTDLKKEFAGETVAFDGSQIKEEDLSLAINSLPLFGQKKLIVIENFFSRRQSKAKEKITAFLKERTAAPIILWEGKKIDGRTLLSFTGAKIMHFEFPALIFKLLDALQPQNHKQVLGLLHQCFSHDSPELIFYLLCRRLGELIIIKDLGPDGLKAKPPWQKTKLSHQAQKFSLAQLIILHQQLLKIDWELKTGRSVLSLDAQLDLLLTAF